MSLLLPIWSLVWVVRSHEDPGQQGLTQASDQAAQSARHVAPSGRTRVAPFARTGLAPITRTNGGSVRANWSGSDSPVCDTRRLAGDPALAQDLGRDIERRGAEALEELFREALSRGDIAAARRHVAEILTQYPDGLATSEAQQMLARLDRATTEEEPTADHRGAEEPAPLMNREHARILRPLTRAMENGRAHHEAGLLASKHFARAHALMTSATRDFDLVIRTGTKLLERHRRNPGLVARLSELVARARVAQQESLLDAASLCVVRGQFSSGLGEVNRVLAINPGNRRALDMRARIEIAANEWGYDP